MAKKLLLPLTLVAAAAGDYSAAASAQAADQVSYRRGRRLGNPAAAAAAESAASNVRQVVRRSTRREFGRRDREQQQQQQDREVERELPAADWMAWPPNAVSSLQVVYCLGDDANWNGALSTAADNWSSRSSKVNLVVPAGDENGCVPELNADLSHIDGKIHVVYGTCGRDCCGYTDVEYSYDGDGTVTEYSALVRIDKSCFGPDDADGMLYIMCHELGHALGLGHNYAGDSCLGDFHDSNTPGWDDVDTLDYDLYADAPDARNAGGPSPTPAPVAVQAQQGQQGQLSTVGCSTGQPCGPCEGGCDSDDECEGGLVCYMRNGFDAVPGCAGYGIAHFDYCYDPN